jgi:hypothetical protein
MPPVMFCLRENSYKHSQRVYYETLFHHLWYIFFKKRINEIYAYVGTVARLVVQYIYMVIITLCKDLR